MRKLTLGLAVSSLTALSAIPAYSAESCPQWDISGRWVFHHTNGIDVTFVFRQTGTEIAGTGYFRETADWDTNNTGPVVGSIAGNVIQFTVDWELKRTYEQQHYGIGNYTGAVGPSGNIGGSAFASNTPTVSAGWSADHNAKCQEVAAGPPAPPPDPNAVDPLFCVDYANKAVAQAREKESLNCRPEIGSWRPNQPGEYANWCMGAKRTEANSSLAGREGILAACRLEIAKAKAPFENPGARVTEFLPPPAVPGATEGPGSSVSEVLGVPASTPAVPPAPGGYLIMCRGGGGMSARPTDSGYVFVRFAAAPTTVGYPEAGMCRWSDRVFNPGEPLVLAYPRRPGDDQIAADLLRAAKNGGPFQVHANNSGQGALLVTSLDQVEALPDAPAQAGGTTQPGSTAATTSTATVLSAVNVRDGGKHKTVIGKLAAGAQIAVVGCDSYWCQVLVNVPGGVGHVSRKYLSLGAVGTTPGLPIPPAAALPPVEANNPPPAPAGIDISGTWDSHTDKGWQYTIVLEAGPGGGVAGSYTAQDGSQALLSGKLKGSVLSFNWATIPPTYKGLGRFTFNGDSFSGNYSTTEFPDPNTNPAQLAGTWTGTRQ